MTTEDTTTHALIEEDPKPYRDQITGVVLAGGRSRRMGRDKSLIVIGGEPLVKRAVRLLKPYCAKIVIVTNNLEETKELGWPDYVSIIPDDIPFQGPLGGLATSSNYVDTPWMLVRAVDMPWLAPGLIDMMWDHAEEHDVVIPLSKRGNEPLCALYRTQAARKWIQKVLDTGRRRVISFFKYVRINVIDRETVHQLDPHEDSFLNINHPDQVIDIDNELKTGDCLLPSAATRKASASKVRGKDGGAFEAKVPKSNLVISQEASLEDHPSLQKPKPSITGRAIKVLQHKPGTSALPTEQSITIYLNDIEVSTVQATLSDLDDMAIGFLVSEGLLQDRSKLDGIDIDKKHGLVYVTSQEVVPDQLVHKTSKRYVTSGCGKGVTFSSAEEISSFNKVRSAITVEPTYLNTWIGEMSRLSEAYKNSGGSHSAGLVVDNELIIIREDVGRHNAADKVIGNAWRKGIPFEKSILLCTGRLSYEITAKAARRGIPVVASRSAATDLSASIAQEMGITLVGYVKASQVVVYTHPERIIGAERNDIYGQNPEQSVQS